MIILRPYNDSDYKDLDYQLPVEQSKFTSTIYQCKKDDVFIDFQKIVVSVIYNEFPIGFFILEKGNDKLKLTDNKTSIMLRSFSINPLYQGKGLGKKTMLLIIDYVQKNFKNIDEIALSVNIKNKNAYHTYLNSGFTDTQKYINGVMGKQHVLVKKV